MDQSIAALNYESADFAGLYAQVLNQIHYEIDAAELKKNLIQLIKAMGEGEVVDYLPLNKMTIEGAIAYCLNRGALLSPLSHQRVQAFVAQAKAESQREIIWEPILTSLSGTGAIILTDCIARIDNAKTRLLMGKSSVHELPIEVRGIVEKYAQNKSLIIKRLCEYYQLLFKESMADPRVKTWVQPLNIICQTLQLMNSSKTSKKTGAKSAQDRLQTFTSAQRDRAGDQAAKRITINTETNVFGLTGVSPENIVGAKIAVVFNLKTKVLEVYYAAESQTLSIKGARITNIDPSTSEGKVIRDPKTMLPHWCNASSPRRVEVLAQGIKAKGKPSSGKLNRNSLILKVL
jgi:hypothetical protein